jgi:cell filamentation protein
MNSTTGNSDPYVYPGTNTLKNLRQIRDPRELREYEALSVARRLIEMQNDPVTGAMDTERLQSIHRRLFQDVYSWAGEFRTTNTARGGQFAYAFPYRIKPTLDATFAKLQTETNLKNSSADEFGKRAAHYLGEINAVHAFREGNGRTQREFLRQFAVRNGHDLNWTTVTQTEMYEACHRSFQHGDNSGLEEVVQAAVRQGNQDRAHQQFHKQFIEELDEGYKI